MHENVRGRVRPGALLVLVLIASTMVLGMQAPGSQPDPKVLRRLRAAETTAHDAVLVGANVTLGTTHPECVRVPLLAFATGDGKARAVMLREIRVHGPVGEPRATLHPEARLTPTRDVAESTSDLLRALSDRDQRAAIRVAQRGFVVSDLEIPLAGLRLRDDSTTNLAVAATFDVDGAAHTTTLPLSVTVAALPSAPYWAAGDGHVHSSWSDGWNTLATQVAAAKNAGHKWIVMTDHWKGIWATLDRGNANWPLYQADCTAKQGAYGLPVLPGTEIMAASDKGHALAYGLAASQPPPRDEYFSAASLVSAINTHQLSKSYAVVAHPYSATPWSDWTSPKFRTIELMSQQVQASKATQDRWFTLLRSGTAGRIAGGGFVVGVANTDAHAFWQQPGEAGVTWLRSRDATLTRESVWNAISLGAASASGRGDLGYFTLNGIQQGGVAIASSATKLTFAITQKPVTGRKCTEISIRSSANAVVWRVSNPGLQNYVKTLPVPSGDTFYVVKMVFSKTGGTDYSHVWCNPVFVDRR